MMMKNHDRDFYSKQLAEIHQYARQHINLVAGGFLTFAALNGSFATLSRSVTEIENSRFAISMTICLGFSIGDAVAALVFFGAAIQLIGLWLKAEKIIQKLDIGFLDADNIDSRINLLADPLLRLFSIDKSRLSCPANPIPLRETVATFVGFSIICLVVSLVWFTQFVFQYLS